MHISREVHNLFREAGEVHNLPEILIHCRANMAHVSQSRPDFGLGLSHFHPLNDAGCRLLTFGVVRLFSWTADAEPAVQGYLSYKKTHPPRTLP